MIEANLGMPRYIATPAESSPEVGVVTGLAWTAAGGELMFIEALRMPGKGRLIITGLLGNVMRESVSAAYSYVRSRGEELGIEDQKFKDSDVHVHFPVGAIPKDGPSAGIAVTLAIASTLSNRPVRHDIAMTGEVTLRGKVLEVGGIKEKVLAASRAGLKRVILPQGNERDLLREVPEEIQKESEFDYVGRMEEVIRLALLEKNGKSTLDSEERSGYLSPLRTWIMFIMMGILAACGNGAAAAATLPPERVESEGKAFQRWIFFVREDGERLDLLACAHTVLAREAEVERGAALWHLGEGG